MKITALIFPIIALLLWGGANAYVSVRIWQSLVLPACFKIPYIILMVLFFLLLPGIMLLRENFSPEFSGVMQMIGGTWMIILLYAFLFFFLFDIVRIINYIRPFYPDIILSNYILVKRLLFSVGFIFITTILIVGNWKFNHPKVTELELTTTKSLGSKKELTIAFFSDLHLGSLVTGKQLQRYVNLINEQNADLVLIGGDLMDGDHEVWVKRDFASMLKSIHSQYGTYTALGNHEYYNGLSHSLDFIKSAGIQLLRDQTMRVGEEYQIVLVGRDDKTNQYRQPLNQIMKPLKDDATQQRYTILLDHQPGAIKEAADEDVDLMLCGHTHNGQIFPLTAFIHMMWEVAYGYRKIDTMDLYVSSGLGLWGPQYRIGSNSEIVKIRITEE